MNRICSFPPVATARSRVLILGSMPGVASLSAQQYYAHPRNLFWPIMGALFDAGLDKSYDQRLRILKASGVAVWDVLQSCIREGSLDSAIQSEIPNDFDSFFESHRRITHVFFNGTKAEQSFRRHVGLREGYNFMRLPSTSPAHAGMNFAAKRQMWSGALVKVLSVEARYAD